MPYYPDKKWLVIVNPIAGKKRGEKDWAKISQLLNESEIKFTCFFTKGKNHAIDLAAQNIEQDYKNIIVVGGDGTMNEVVNGIFTQKKYPSEEIILGMIIVGTGNDWGRMFNIPVNYPEAISILKTCKTIKQDIGLVKYYISDEEKKRYFINIAGLGFDAQVVKKANQQKEKGYSGVFLYFINILTNLFKYKSIKAEIIIDGKKTEDEIFSVSIGIGKYAGGGMMQTPNAIPDDGLLDITVIKKMKKIEIIRNLGRLYNGTILEHPRVEGFTARNIHIDADQVINLETDGESLGHSPIEFDILPRSLNVITN
jgi:YegS/Rv2252/BmrU family lipid kinase